MIQSSSPIFQPLLLPCGQVLKNRLVKAAMSDSLGDGRGNPTPAQIHLYETWANGGVAASIIGEVQGDPRFAEKPGNLVLGPGSDRHLFKALAKSGTTNAAQLWLQLGHAGAMSHPPIGTPMGPSALTIPGLTCAEMSLDDIRILPSHFAQMSVLAKDLGFGGVEIHAAHGFLLSQFLSPLFNQRQDGYGGALSGRMRLVLEVVDAVRAAVGPAFPIAIKLNSSDQLEGGFAEDEALEVVAALDRTGLDLIDISGGTYFPGAKSASDSAAQGAYFLNFAKRARGRTRKPLMVTGGFKTRQQVSDALVSGDADVVGLARALALEPALPNLWASGSEALDPSFPRFTDPPEGGVTAWYSMRLTEIGEARPYSEASALDQAVQDYQERDARRIPIWNAHFYD